MPLVLPFHSTAKVNACRSLQQMVLRDPVPEEAAAGTPLFRWFASGAALTGQQLHTWVRSMMERIGECPIEYGTHSLRIGGATSLADAKCPDRII